MFLLRCKNKETFRISAVKHVAILNVNDYICSLIQLKYFNYEIIQNANF
jgi:hypothetical protein